MPDMPGKHNLITYSCQNRVQSVFYRSPFCIIVCFALFYMKFESKGWPKIILVSF